MAQTDSDRLAVACLAEAIESRLSPELAEKYVSGMLSGDAAFLSDLTEAELDEIISDDFSNDMEACRER